jgi:hypothetical protein
MANGATGFFAPMNTVVVPIEVPLRHECFWTFVTREPTVLLFRVASVILLEINMNSRGDSSYILSPLETKSGC